MSGQVQTLHPCFLPGRDDFPVGFVAYVGGMHYDLVSPEPARHAVEAPDEDVLPIAQLFAAAFKRKGGRQSNLTNEAGTKHRKVCEDNVVPEAEGNFYRRSVTESRAFGGVHNRVVGSETFALHWRTYKAYVSFLLGKEPVTSPVTARDALTRENVRAYFQELQVGNSSGLRI